MKFVKLVMFVLFLGCSGQDEILQEDAERGIVLRKTNIEVVGCWGEAGQGGTKPVVRLEVESGGAYAIPASECPGEISFDASHDPIRLHCGDVVRPLYRLGTIRGVLGRPGDDRPMHEAADFIVEERGQPILKELLTEAHERGVVVETLISLGDADCGDYWDVGFEGLSLEEQGRVLEGLRDRKGSSELRDSRLASHGGDGG